jgi:hypothetical protein
MVSILLSGIIGLIVIGIVALKPKLFWPALIIVTIGTAGLMVGGKYTFLDEYLVGCILLGGFMTISIGAVTLQKDQEDIWSSLHKWIFLIMVLYMIAQSFRGLIVLESLRKIRWVVYFGMLGIMAFIISNKGFPVPSGRKISLIIAISTLGYLILYIVWGLFSEIVRGISRWDLLCVEWGTTAYSSFPLVIAIPAVILLLKDRSHIYRWVGWITLITAILEAFYYDSRVSWLVIFGFLFVSLFKLGIRRVIFFLSCFLLIFSLYLGINNKAKFAEESSIFWGKLSKTAQSICFWNASTVTNVTKTEIERKAHMQVGFISVMQNWKSFLFGYGYQVSGVVIGPHLKKIYEDSGFPEFAATVKEDQSTVGFTALFVDTGWIGILLLGMSFLFIARKILIQKKDPYRLLFLLSLLFTFLWLFVVNIADIVLFYFLIMPNGLLVQLSRYGTTEQPFEENK